MRTERVGRKAGSRNLEYPGKTGTIWPNRGTWTNPATPPEACRIPPRALICGKLLLTLELEVAKAEVPQGLEPSQM